MNRRLLTSLTLVALCASGANAVVVTSNNLLTATVGTGTLAATSAPVLASFTTSAGMLNGVTATVQSTQISSPANGMIVDAISPVTNPVVTAGLLAFDSVNKVPATPYGPALHNLIFAAPIGATSENYHLGLQAQLPGWQWQATGITSYRPAGADRGVLGFSNLVPNASFENTTINFMPGMVYVTDGTAPHGSEVVSLTGTNTVDRHISIPVQVGTLYAYSFWFKGTGDIEIEWGLTLSGNGHAIGAGNQIAGSTSNVWTEKTGTFTPTIGQTTFFIGGMSNGGAFSMDSFLVSVIPEPITAGVVLMGAPLLLRRRA